MGRGLKDGAFYVQLDRLACVQLDRQACVLRYPRHPMITLTIDSHYIPSQERQRESYKLKKRLSLKFFQQSLHAAHLLKLLDKMGKYEMDPASIVEDTERTRFGLHTDGRTDGQT